MKREVRILQAYLKYKFSPARWKREKIEHWQRKKIKRHLERVTRDIPFYRSYRGAALEALPIMDKQSFMNHFEQLNSKGITEEQAIQFAVAGERSRGFDDKLEQITVGLSSGTSGRRGAFLVSDAETCLWAGYVLSHFLPRGILHPCNIAFFMRANSNLYQAVESKRIQFQFFDILEDIQTHLPKLNAMQPQILVGQPSVLLVLAKAANGGALSIKPEKIISVAEVLEERDAAIIKEAFQVIVLHQAYQCTEGCLALTCRYGHLHLNEDVVAIEKEYLDEDRFIPVVTDFTRQTQPILRYRLNDILQENREPCPCGSHFTRIEKIEGREDDVFFFQGVGVRENTTIPVFPDFIRRCILFSGRVSDYRIVQQEDGGLSVYADTAQAERQSIQHELAELAKEKCFLMPEIEFYPYEADRTRKLKRIESRKKR